jgi:Right handed beta helix region
MTASHRQLSAVALVALALAFVPLIAGTTLPSVGGLTLPSVGVPATPAGTPSLLPAAGIGLPLAMATPCSRVAAPYGSDRASGTLRAPFRTVQRLVNSLRPGQTGCVREGTYVAPVRIARGGRRGARLTLTAYPGETATIVGHFEIVEGADYVTVTGLRLDGANPGRLPSPMVDANHATFSYDDVTNDHTGICFGIGNPTWGWATDTLITHDRVHDCGQLPGDNRQHGFYIGAATGTTIEWSLIYSNAARGIQLYPDAQHTTIDHNIIDGNGEGIMISGEGGVASSYTNVFDNIVSDSTIRHDVESFWPEGNPVGVGNLVHDNCVWRGREGTIDNHEGGFAARHNATLNPEFADAASHDYALAASSPCLSAIGDVQAAVEGTTPTAPTLKMSPFSPSPLPASRGLGGLPVAGGGLRVAGRGLLDPSWAR